MNPGILYVEFLVLAHRIHRLSTACGQSCHGILGMIHEPVYMEQRMNKSEQTPTTQLFDSY